MGHRLTSDKVKAYTFAGDAIITLQSGVTSKHYTFRITKCKDNEELYFVKVLYGTDNESDYRYIGCYFTDSRVFSPCKDYKDLASFAWPKYMRTIAYFFDVIDNIPDKLLVYHEGRCGKCGRKLTTPESIERGLGPECYKEAANGNR